MTLTRIGVITTPHAIEAEKTALFTHSKSPMTALAGVLIVIVMLSVAASALKGFLSMALYSA